MNDYQEEKLASNKLVVKLSKENPAVTSLIPEFEEGITQLEAINNEIEENRTLQEQDKSGVTKNKKFTIDNLRDKTLEVAGAVHAYASKKKDVLLMAEVDFKIGKISGMVPGKIISAATTTLGEAKKIPADELAKMGITSEELSAYEEVVTYFKTISGSTREVQIETTVYTKRIAALFKESTRLFKNTLDKLAIQFKSKAPEYYLKYRSARKAIHRGPDNDDAKGGSDATK